METGSRREAHGLGDVRLHARIDVGERAHGARDGAGGDFLAGAGEAELGTGEFGISLRQLDAERGRLGMDAVAAADRDRGLVLEGALFQCGEQAVETGGQHIGSAHELHVEAGVEDIGGGKAQMHEAGFGSHMLGKVGQESDDVMLGDALDLVDAGDIELGLRALLPDDLGCRHGNEPELRHGGGGVRLDLEPDAETRLRFPDLRHLGARVARDHGRCLGPSQSLTGGLAEPDHCFNR